MAFDRFNGVGLRYELNSEGDVPLALVHGSWGSHQQWDAVAAALSDQYRVLSYDRRGHGESERPSGQGSVREDVADLAALIEALGLAPVYVAGNSFGSAITLRLAVERADLVRGIILHEPPLFPLVAGDAGAALALQNVGAQMGTVIERIESGDHAGAAEQFMTELALAPGGVGAASSCLPACGGRERADLPRRGEGSRCPAIRPRVDDGLHEAGPPHNGGGKPVAVCTGARHAGQGMAACGEADVPERWTPTARHASGRLRQSDHDLHSQAPGAARDRSVVIHAKWLELPDLQQKPACEVRSFIDLGRLGWPNIVHIRGSSLTTQILSVLFMRTLRN